MSLLVPTSGEDGGVGGDLPGLLDVSRSRTALEVRALRDAGSRVQRFQRHYSSVGKADWWWIFDDALKEMARQLLTQDFVVLDNFVSPSLSANVKSELRAMRNSGAMKPGLLAGGRSGTNVKYTLGSVRGDHVAWVDGQQPTQAHLHTYLQRVDTCVSELGKFLPELRTITSRSEAMCTCYPGGGARYTRHCDNPNQNGRKLTALLYLNEAWHPSDGGELRVCHPPPYETRPKAELSPLAGRVVLFWSDKRVPHEVLPTSADRFTVTVWYFDGAEKALADEFARKAAAACAVAQEVGDGGGTAVVDPSTQDERDRFLREQERIRAEIRKFEQLSDGSDPASVLAEGGTVAGGGADGDGSDGLGAPALAAEPMPKEAVSEGPQAADRQLPQASAPCADSDDKAAKEQEREGEEEVTSGELASRSISATINAPAVSCGGATPANREPGHAEVTARLREHIERTAQAAPALSQQSASRREQRAALRQQVGDATVSAWRQAHVAEGTGSTATSPVTTTTAPQVRDSPTHTSDQVLRPPDAGDERASAAATSAAQPGASVTGNAAAAVEARHALRAPATVAAPATDSADANGANDDDLPGVDTDLFELD